MAEPPATGEQNQGDRALQSRGQVGFDSSSVRCLQLLHVAQPGLVGLHLSTIAIAAQDRRHFELLLGLEGERALWGAWAVLALMLLRAVLRAVLRGELADEPLARALGVMALVVWGLFSAGVGTGSGRWSALDFDTWCGLMSSTSLGMPLHALAYLLGVTLLAVEAKYSLEHVPGRASSGCSSSGGSGFFRRSTSGPWAWVVAVWVAVAGVACVLQLATGSAAPI